LGFLYENYNLANQKNIQKFLYFVFCLRTEKSQIGLYTLSNFVQDFKFAHLLMKKNLLLQIIFIMLIFPKLRG